MCKIKKPLYSLKQSPQPWFDRLIKLMKAFGYIQSNSDHTLFLKCKKDKSIALIIYVDDIVVTWHDLEERAALQTYMSQEFKMKDLGLLKYFLGMNWSLKVFLGDGSVYIPER